MNSYNVYRCPEGGSEEFIGTASTLNEARRMAKRKSLPKSLYDTARAAGHCGGLTAPDTTEEDESRVEWITDEVCAVPVSES